MNRGYQLKFNQLKVIIVAWVLIGFLIAVHDYTLLHTTNSLGPSAQYSFWVSAVTSMGSGLIGALIGGSFLVFYVNVKYQDKPYGYTIMAVTIVFILIVIFISVLLAFILVSIRTGKPLSDPVAWAAFKLFLKDPSHLKALIVWSFIVAVTQLLLQVNSKFGQANFWNIIRGKYNQPKKEKRIFMFLDINSSTTIAEQLGDETYHSILKDFFADITYAILNNKGTIYQYVGDAVIVVWNYEDGKENVQCIRCFLDMKLQIQKKKKNISCIMDLFQLLKQAYIAEV